MDVNSAEAIRRKKLFIKQKEEAIKKIAKQYYYDRIKSDPEEISSYIPTSTMEDFTKWCVKSTGQRYKYVMITVNFKDGIDSEIMWKKIYKFLKKKWIVSYIYCLEQRSITELELGKGIHMHCRVELKEGAKPYECKRQTYNTFKHLVGNKLHVNCRYSNKPECFIDYIKGYKNGVIKPTTKMDIKWRKQNLYKDLYTSK